MQFLLSSFAVKQLKIDADFEDRAAETCGSGLKGHAVHFSDVADDSVLLVLNVVTLTSVAKQIVDMSRNLTMIKRSLNILMRALVLRPMCPW